LGIVWGIVLGTAWGIVLEIALGIGLGIGRGARNSNPHRVFTFQNFEGIILYVKNEFDYTKRIVGEIVGGIV
jgi:hypothetical protein